MLSQQYRSSVSCYSFGVDFPILIELSQILKLYSYRYRCWCERALNDDRIIIPSTKLQIVLQHCILFKYRPPVSSLSLQACETGIYSGTNC